MEHFGENVKARRPTKPCPADGKYLDIFNFKVDMKVANTVENIVTFRENYMEKKICLRWKGHISHIIGVAMMSIYSQYTCI